MRMINLLHKFLFALLFSSFISHIHTTNSRDQLWIRWKSLHDKLYNSNTDEQLRRSIWEKKLEQIAYHNLLYDLGLKTYTLGLNQFSDLEWNEFKQIYLETINPQTIDRNNLIEINEFSQIDESVDWVKKGYVTQIKDQGECGSCWAFSACGAMEGQMIPHFGFITDLSVQQLVDCSFSYGNDGCNGGLMNKAFSYVRDNGIERDSSYPYIADVQDCEYNSSKSIVQVKAISFVPEGDEHSLQYFVSHYGPVSVAMDVEESFMSYRSGVYQSDDCSSESVNHGLLAVGYGSVGISVDHDEDSSPTRTDKDIPYWLLKNSWGKHWGEKGYAKLRRNYDNLCGIASVASIPFLS